MKNKLRILAYALSSALVITSCDDNEEKFYINSSDSVSPAILSPESGSIFELSIENETAQATTLVWSDAKYSEPTEISYSVEFALSGTDFAEPTTIAETSNTYVSWTVSELNDYAIALGLSPFTAGDVDVRVKSSIGSQDAQVLYSDTVTLTITAYTATLPKIAVPGNHQGWDPGSAPELAASAYGETDYEGYLWLDGDYKFIAPDATGAYAWGNTDWGDDGTFSGHLVVDNESNCTAASAGHYYVKADTDALTYSAVKYDWGLIGSATPGGWDSDQNMSYSNGTWTITLDLVAGEIKFRANDAWDWNYGDSGADGLLDAGGDNIAIAAGGNYTIVLDLSSPREYTYTITQN